LVVCWWETPFFAYGLMMTIGVRVPYPLAYDGGPAGSGPMIEAAHLTKRFGAKTAVDDLSFTVAPGAVTGFLGPNGAGKTNLGQRHFFPAATLSLNARAKRCAFGRRCISRPDGSHRRPVASMAPVR
jgi:hypothetical protein